MKICIIKDGAGWVIDNIYEDFRAHTTLDYAGINTADLIWCLSFWDFEKVFDRPQPKVVTIHHVVEPKWQSYRRIFGLINSHASAVLTPNKHTAESLSGKIRIRTHRLPYWLLTARMQERDNDRVAALKRQINPEGRLLIGSFQKDSDTSSGKSKWEKNPEMFVNIVKKVNEATPAMVVLAGRQRGYVVGELASAGIPHVYYPMSDRLNDLYDCLDWYLVTSRVEGGPQAALECAWRKVNILSTDCGLASGVLEKNCICGTVDDFYGKIIGKLDERENNYCRIKDNFTYEKVIPKYDEFFLRIAR